MPSHSTPTVDEVLQVLGISQEEIADWSSTVAQLKTRDSAERWNLAQEALSPTSSAGPIFGVTNRDLKRAASRLSRTGPSPRAQRGKRVYDVIFSLSVLIFSAPLLLVIAAAIKLDSKGPVFYRAERVGLGGKHFGLLKFRTMKEDSSFEFPPNSELGGYFIIKNDPRITRVGRVLRKLSYDEVPQFFNVLFGEMSIVGARPRLPSEVVHDRKVARVLAQFRPGITGLWQVSGRSDLTWEDAVRLDVYFLENWTLMTDFIITLKTLREAFRRH